MQRILGRRALMQKLVAGVAATAEFARDPARGAEVRRETFTYKTVGDCAIKADVFRASTRETLPVAVWIHGGALIMGDRHGINATLRDTLVNAGYAVVSIDYRLAPETKLTGILEDVRDAFAGSDRMGRNTFAREPYEQTVLMDQVLARQGVPHEFVSVPNGGHGLGNIDRDVVAGIYRKAVAFIGRHSA